MPKVVTISRPDVIALIEEAAKKLARATRTGGCLSHAASLGPDARAGSLSEAHRGSIRVREAVDLIVPALDVEPDAETGREIEQ